MEIVLFIQPEYTWSSGPGQSKLAMPVKTCRSVGLLDYWIIGMLDVIQTEVDKPRFRQSNAVMIGSVNVIWQNKLR